MIREKIFGVWQINWLFKTRTEMIYLNKCLYISTPCVHCIIIKDRRIFSICWCLLLNDICIEINGKSVYNQNEVIDILS